MSDVLRQKLEQLEAKRAELDRFRTRLGEANRLVAQESDRLVNLMGQLSTLLKRETWNAMMGTRAAPGRPAGAGGPRPPQGRPPAPVSSALTSQAAAAVDAAIKQADAVQGRLASLVRGLTETPATVRPAAPADEEEELAIDMEPAPCRAVRVAAVAPPKAPTPPYTGPSSAAWSKSHPPQPLVAPAPVVAAAPRPVAPVHPAAPEPAAPAQAAPASAEDIQEAASEPPDRRRAGACRRPRGRAGCRGRDGHPGGRRDGRKALESLDRSLSAAREVSHGGVLQTAAGVVRSQSPARVRLGEARQAAREAAENLRLLQKQVKELRHRLGGPRRGRPIGRDWRSSWRLPFRRRGETSRTSSRPSPRSARPTTRCVPCVRGCNWMRRWSAATWRPATAAGPRRRLAPVMLLCRSRPQDATTWRE